MKALIIKKEPLEKIFHQNKTWEIRSTNTKIRGKILLIQSKSKTIVGQCTLTESIGPLSQEQYYQNKDKSKATSTNLPYQKTYAWVLKDPIKYRTPKLYVHPQGTVIWVNIND